METVKGDLIQLALNGKFDVIAHGCNCFSTQKSGIAKQMAEVFFTNEFPMEVDSRAFPINKLGCIDWDTHVVEDNFLSVVNCYTQYQYGTDKAHADYEAIALCMRKINILFRGKHIGLPMIGAGLAGGDWTRISAIINQELKDMKVTIVEYDGRTNQPRRNTVY